MKILKRLAGRTVLRGPFKGLIYDGDTWGSKYPSKLLGTYELETQHFHEQLIADGCSNIAVIGAADGFFAAGLAMKIPAAKVWAFEIEAVAREMMRELAVKNGVADRVTILGACTWQGFCEFLAEHKPEAVVMDVEGAEVELLRGIDDALLNDCRLLVELHDYGKSDASRPVIERLARTHDIEVIPAVERSPDAAGGFLVRLGLRCFQVVGRNYLYERPPGMSWVIALPRKVQPAGGADEDTPQDSFSSN